MALRRLAFFLRAQSVHSQNVEEWAKAYQPGNERDKTNPGPNRPASQSPDNQCNANNNANDSICVSYVCNHVALRLLKKCFVRLSAVQRDLPSIFNSLVVLSILLLATPAKADVGDDFLAAREAWAAGDMRRFDRYANKLPEDDALYPYIAYWKVARQLDNDAKIADFLAMYSGSWLAEKLRAEWLKDLGRRELWPAYQAEFPKLEKPDTSHLCLARRAELMAGDNRSVGDAVSLWFTGKDLPSSCTQLFAALLQLKWLTEEDVWKRLRLALGAGNTGVAKSLLNYLPEESRPGGISMDQALRDPDKYLSGETTNWGNRGSREVAFFALSRLARKDTVAAARAIEPNLLKLSEADQQYMWGVLALYAARSHEPQALPWFEKNGGNGLSDLQREWWARSALRAGDWRTTLWAVSGMTTEMREQAVWRYWRARALKAIGQVLAANQIFAPLSREHHYYGQLAAEELGAVLGGQTINIKVSGEEVNVVSRDSAVARALALYALGLRTEAANEWIWAVRNFNDRQLLAAAELARRNDWYDRAINTAEKTQDQHDFDLRFISPYRDLASKEAKENSLDEAWVFGLIRQESRFVNVAKSSVGAQGLMQIMPATGRWIAQRLGIKGFKTGSLSEPETNIKFGAYYLKHVMDSLDGQPVLATAAYNAGPRRAQRWRDSKAMEAAVYIESIPFNETREYVKKVMSNAMYYALRFGQPSVLLSDRLGTIPARNVPAPPEDENDKQPSLEASGDES